MSKSQKKRFENIEERKRVGKNNLGRRLTAEHKAKISKAITGKKWPIESRIAIGTKIYCLELKKFYNSSVEAFRDIKHIDQNNTTRKSGSYNIIAACKGKRKRLMATIENLQISKQI